MTVRRSRNGKPAVVGVSACLDSGRTIRPGREYWYLARAYTRALSQAGAVPLVVTPDTSATECVRLCDGIVLSGGGDLPARFSDPEPIAGQAQRGPAQPAAGGEAELPGEAESPLRIEWERRVLGAFATARKPVLGICFGMQLINLHFGGSLLVDLRSRTPKALDHGGQRGARPHACKLEPGSDFFAGCSAPEWISSSHGQAVGRLAPGFRASAHAPDGVIEALERAPLVGLQWHPEADSTGPFVFRRFVDWVCRDWGLPGDSRGRQRSTASRRGA